MIVLLADDNRLLLATLAAAIRARGHEVLEADSGEEALEWSSRRRPDVGLVDLHMPRVSGAEVAQHLRSIDVPFVLLSAYGESSVKSAARELGAAGYLLKPADAEAVIAALAHAVEGDSGSRTTPALFAMLKQLRDFETRSLPELETPEDFAIVWEIGAHQQDEGPPLTPGVLLLSNLGAPATIQRRLKRLMNHGHVIVTAADDDARRKQLSLSRQLEAKYAQYQKLLMSCVARFTPHPDMARSETAPAVRNIKASS